MKLKADQLGYYTCLSLTDYMSIKITAHKSQFFYKLPSLIIIIAICNVKCNIGDRYDATC